MRYFVSCYFIVINFFLCAGCTEKAKPMVLMELLSPEKTGIEFSNEIREDENLNILSFEYFYNGAGVGTGDFNKDGLTDIFFSSNMGKSRIYLNQGSFLFRDITDSSGLNTAGKWASGVSVVDTHNFHRSKRCVGIRWKIFPPQ